MSDPANPSNAPQGMAKSLGPAALLAAAAAFLPPLGSIVLFYFINDVGAWLQSHQALGVVIYVLGFAILAGLALLPTYASAILGGWAFGFIPGFPAALCGFLGGCLIGYAVARPTASDRVMKIIEDRPRWKAVRDALVGGSPLKTFIIVTLLRLPPNSPFALTNLLLASVRVPVWIYAPATLLGMAPRTGIAVAIAAQLQNQLASDAAKMGPPTWVLISGGVLAVAVVIIIGVIANRALDRLTAPQAR